MMNVIFPRKKEMNLKKNIMKNKNITKSPEESMFKMQIQIQNFYH